MEFPAPALTLGRTNGHPNALVDGFNNAARVVNNRPSGGSGGISFDIYDNGAYNKTPLYLEQAGNWLPGADAAYNVGSASFRLNTVYASTGTINTSDKREKQQITDLSDAEKAAATQLKGMIRKFKWNSSVEEKGDGARWHVGVMAQEVRDVFAEQGLDAHEYGLLCYDEWNGGDRYGVRYDELLSFIIAAI